MFALAWVWLDRKATEPDGDSLMARYGTELSLCGVCCKMETRPPAVAGLHEGYKIIRITNFTPRHTTGAQQMETVRMTQ